MPTVQAPKNQVNVRVEQVFRTREHCLYPLHDREQQRAAYRVNTPDTYQLQADHASISVPGLMRSQLDPAVVEKLGNSENSPYL